MRNGLGLLLLAVWRAISFRASYGISKIHFTMFLGIYSVPRAQGESIGHIRGKWLGD